MGETAITKDRATKSLKMERVFDAPRERVWQAWTDPEQFKQWWGPRGWQTEVKEANFRVGGTLHYGMKCVDESQGELYGQTSWGKMEFVTVDEPSSFTYKDVFSDEDGNVNPDMPAMTITVTFTEEDGKTRVVSTGVFESEEAYDKVIAMGVEQGAAETWDRLAEYLK